MARNISRISKRAAGVVASFLALATAPAFAAVVVSGFTLDSGSFGTQFGVHTNGGQTGTTLNAHVNGDGSAVTFTSTGSLAINGSGEATIESSVKKGQINNLNVSFAKSWDKITFDFEKASGAFTLLVNGSALFNSADCSTLCAFGKGANKFILSGNDISSLAFSFDKGVGTAKQFRVENFETTGVPEPATWGLMILGIGLAGGAMRRRAGGMAKLAS